MTLQPMNEICAMGGIKKEKSNSLSIPYIILTTSLPFRRIMTHLILNKPEIYLITILQ